MSILAVDLTYQPTGGTLSQIKEIIKNIDSYDFNKVVFFTTKDNLYLFENTNEEKVILKNVFFSNKSIVIRTIWAQIVLPILLILNRIDILFCPGNISPIFNTRIKTQWIGTIGPFENKFISSYSMKEKIKIYITKYLMIFSSRTSDFVIFESDYTRNLFLKKYKQKKEKSSVLHRGHHEFFKPVETYESKIFAEHDFKEYILIVSHLYPYKNIELFLEAYSHLRLYDRDLYVMIAGSISDEKYYQRLKLMVNELGISKFIIFLGQVEKKSLIKNKLKVESWKYPNITISTNFVSTKFSHDLATKESGLRTNGNLNISRPFAIKYPIITPNASINLTKYSLKNSPNISRTVFGSGLNIDFTINNKTRVFGYEANHRITPLISYNYRAKKVQGNIPIFDTEDKYTDIISFADLTSGERYTGIDRITNANDITLSLESSHRDVDALDEDKDLLNMRIAQTFYDDNEVVSATSSTDYETRKRYSDIAASIDIAVGKYVFTNSVQFNPDTSKIVKKENSLTYTSNSRKFITASLSKIGTSSGVTETEKLYGAYPITDSIHFFGGLDKTVSTGITNSETTGLAYESCCWAFRVAHFKEDNASDGYNYSTGMELVLTGLGSTSTPLKGKIENKIPGYRAKLR